MQRILFSQLIINTRSTVQFQGSFSLTDVRCNLVNRALGLVPFVLMDIILLNSLELFTNNTSKFKK